MSFRLWEYSEHFLNSSKVISNAIFFICSNTFSFNLRSDASPVALSNLKLNRDIDLVRAKSRITFSKTPLVRVKKPLFLLSCMMLYQGKAKKTIQLFTMSLRSRQSHLVDDAHFIKIENNFRLRMISVCQVNMSSKAL